MKKDGLFNKFVGLINKRSEPETICENTVFSSVNLNAFNNKMQDKIFNNLYYYSDPLIISTIYAAMNILIGDISTIPINIYKKNDKTKAKITDVPEFNVLHDMINPYFDVVAFKKIIIKDLLLYGNSYFWIERNSKKQVIGLWPLINHNVNIQYDINGWVPTYNYLDKTYKHTDILHFKNIILDYENKLGISMFNKLRSTLQISLNLEEFALNYLENGTLNDGFLSPIESAPMDPQELKIIMEQIQKQYSGIKNSGNVPVLPNLKWNPTRGSLVDSQFIEQRKYQTLEICKIFRIPPSKLNTGDKASYNNTESEAISYVQGLIPWVTSIEHELNNKIFNNKEYYVKMNTDSLIRADIKTRFNAYYIGRNMGLYSINEIRELEDMAPIEGGDDHTVPLNMGITTAEGIINPNLNNEVLKDEQTEQ